MRRTLLLLLAASLCAVSCGTAAQWAQAGYYSDGIYYKPSPAVVQVQLYSEEDFKNMAARNIENKADTLTIVANEVNVYNVQSPYLYGSPYFNHWYPGRFGFSWNYGYGWSWGFNSWCYDPWYYGYYDPWYYGYYDPWYYGYSPWYHHHYYDPWYHDHHHHDYYAHRPNTVYRQRGDDYGRGGIGQGGYYSRPASRTPSNIGPNSAGGNAIYGNSGITSRSSYSGIPQRTPTNGGTKTGYSTSSRSSYSPSNNNTTTRSSSSSYSSGMRSGSSYGGGSYGGGSRSSGGSYGGGGGSHSSGGSSSSHSGGGGGGRR